MHSARAALPRRILPRQLFAQHNFHEGMFPHITRESAKGVGVDGPGSTMSVSDSGSAATVRSVAQAFATFMRNALYFKVEFSFSSLKTKYELKRAQFISHMATFVIHFTVFLGRE